MLEIWMIRLCPLETITYESTLGLVHREDLYVIDAKGLTCDQNVANELLLSTRVDIRHEHIFLKS